MEMVSFSHYDENFHDRMVKQHLEEGFTMYEEDEGVDDYGPWRKAVMLKLGADEDPQCAHT